MKTKKNPANNFDSRELYFKTLHNKLYASYKKIVTTKYNELYKVKAHIENIQSALDLEDSLVDKGFLVKDILLCGSRTNLKKFLDAIDLVKKFEKREEPYQYQKFTTDRIIFDDDVCMLHIDDEERPLLPYVATKERTMTQEELETIMSFYEIYTEDRDFTTSFGRHPVRIWKDKSMSLDDFHTLITIVDQSNDLVVRPVNVDSGFSFGIKIYQNIPGGFPGVPDENNALFWISTKKLPEGYTGKQIYDDIVMDTWNVAHLAKYLGRKPSSYEAYLY